MRKEFEMTEEQLATLKEAFKPAPLIAIHCGPARSQQENANAAWKRLGEEMGFEGMSVRPNGKGDRFFTAEVVGGDPKC